MGSKLKREVDKVLKESRRIQSSLGSLKDRITKLETTLVANPYSVCSEVRHQLSQVGIKLSPSVLKVDYICDRNTKAEEWFRRGLAKQYSGDFKGALEDYMIAVRFYPDMDDDLEKELAARIAVEEIEGETP